MVAKNFVFTGSRNIEQWRFVASEGVLGGQLKSNKFVNIGRCGVLQSFQGYE